MVGYSVDKKTGDVSFCYEARVTGRTDDAAGEAALAYVEALGAGTGAYGGEQNPLQEAQFQVIRRCVALEFRLAPHEIAASTCTLLLHCYRLVSQRALPKPSKSRLKIAPVMVLAPQRA